MVAESLGRDHAVELGATTAAATIAALFEPHVACVAVGKTPELTAID